MPALQLTPTQADIQTALRAFLLAILPDGTEVFEGLDNRVPEPSAPGFVSMTVLRRPRLGTNVDALDGTGANATIMQPTMVVFQLDVHSDDLAKSSDNSQLISTMLRDDYAVQFFGGYPGIAPLYADDPRLVSFVNAEQQYEPRYVVEAALQANHVVTVPTQSADALAVDITDVETNPASWPNSTASAP